MTDQGSSFEDALREVTARERIAIERPDLTRAAVLVPFVLRDGAPHLILTTRTMTVAAHKGQISFPGGAAEPDDGGPTETALREADEEIGLDPSLVRPVGLLDDMITITGYLVTPVVGVVSAAAELTPDPREVADIFEAPLATLRDPDNVAVRTLDYDGTPIQARSFDVGGRVIWGATGRIITRLLAALDEVEGGG